METLFVTDLLRRLRHAKDPETAGTSASGGDLADSPKWVKLCLKHCQKTSKKKKKKKTQLVSDRLHQIARFFAVFCWKLCTWDIQACACAGDWRHWLTGASDDGSAGKHQLGGLALQVLCGEVDFHDFSLWATRTIRYSADTVQYT